MFTHGAAAPPGDGNGGGKADSLAFRALMAGAGTPGQDGESDADAPNDRLLSREPGSGLHHEVVRTERNLAATGKILPVRLPELAMAASSPANPIGRPVQFDTSTPSEKPESTEEPETSGFDIGVASPAATVPVLVPMLRHGTMAPAKPAPAQPGRAAVVLDRAVKQENIRTAVEAGPAKGAAPEATVAQAMPTKGVDMAASPVPGKPAPRMVSISAVLAPSAEQPTTPAVSSLPRDVQFTPAVTPIELPFAPKPGRPSREIPAQPDTAGEQRILPEVTSNPVDRVGGDPVVTQQAPSSLAPFASGSLQTPGATERPAEVAQPASGECQTLETQIARELSRIVDTLSVAREAVTAKTATLALDHAEFGEMSLRFDQRRDGQLAVQLAAADPDSHRAVAAAIADRPMFAQADSGSQQQAQAGSNGAARGSLSEREGQSASNNSPRHERNEQRRGNGQTHDTSRGGNGRPGIFA